MKSRLTSVLLLAVLSSAAFAGANSPVGNITNFVPRNSGYHSLFLDVAVPSQGCTSSDRGIIVESDAGGKAILASIMMAISGGNQVDIRVDGCAPINPAEVTDTAPKIVKVGIRLQ